MTLRTGIVGLPNVGKSTLFNALTQSGIAAENYPFCTIDPNVGVVEVPDPRLAAIAGIVEPARVVPAAIEFVDIAGLVAGASRGEGLGNRFLAHIREVDAVAHVVRCFEDVDVTHVTGRVDPLSDIQVVETELALADLDTVSRALERVSRQAKSGDKALLQRQALYERLAAALDEGRPLHALETGAQDRRALRELHLLTAKPTLYIANVAEDGFDANPLLDRVVAHARAAGAGVVTVCARIEAEIAALDEADRLEFLQSLGLEAPGLHRVIHAAYGLLGLQTFFTAGEQEARAWTVQHGATAPRAAGVIHTDFEKGFIRAEVVAYEDFIACRGEAGAREAGKWRLEGKDYVMQEGDIVHFRFNV